MFHVRFGKLWDGENHLSYLNEEAKNIIKTRGTSLSAQIPSELDNETWYLSISDIAYSYCPTNRYLFYKKIERKRPELTLASYKGKIIDEFLEEIYRKIYEYSVNIDKLKDFNLFDEMREQLSSRVDDLKGSFNYEEFNIRPNEEDVKDFFNNLKKLVYHEVLSASSLINYRISNLYDINIEAEFRILFPFDFKLKIAAPSLGVSGSAEIDFLVKKSIIGEIKSEKWHNFYHVGLAGYAMTYEADRKENINLGVVVCPIFSRRRKIPIYGSNANIKIVHEAWRKMFIRNRNERITLVRNQEDPGTPDDNTQCNGCGFYGECWP